jgi:hypothetical protein
MVILWWQNRWFDGRKRSKPFRHSDDTARRGSLQGCTLETHFDAANLEAVTAMRASAVFAASMTQRALVPHPTFSRVGTADPRS